MYTRTRRFKQPVVACAIKSNYTRTPNHMNTITKLLISAASAVLISSQAVTAQTLFLDDFENDNLATGGAGTVNAGFQLVSNSTRGTGTVGESGGLATIATAGTSFDNTGIVSINSFDTSALTSFTATWVVDSQTTPGATLGTELLIQGGTSNGTGDGSGFRAGPIFNFSIGDDAKWNLTANDGTNNAALVSGGNLGTAASVSDGYALTMNLNVAGWTVTSSGLSNNISQSGSWTGDVTFSDFQTDLYVAAMIQANNNNVSRTLNIDSITVAVPETGTFALLAGCFALSSVMLRRRV